MRTCGTDSCWVVDVVGMMAGGVASLGPGGLGKGPLESLAREFVDVGRGAPVRACNVVQCRVVVACGGRDDDGQALQGLVDIRLETAVLSSGGAGGGRRRAPPQSGLPRARLQSHELPAKARPLRNLDARSPCCQTVSTSGEGH